jgi:aminoglycoside phosphotransferase (APT) family kinase protein
MADAIPGYDVKAVEAWIVAHVPALAPPFQWTRLEGGHSNLTYRLRDANGVLAVIRRPPQGELLPKAHDMAREWALISALAKTPVPVPAPLGFCESPAVTGAHFYVMGFVDGHPLYTAADVEKWVPPANRRRFGESFFDVLADLHSVDPDAVGLSDLGKKDEYVARQLRTWYKSWTASVADAQFDDARAHDLQRYLLANVPDQGPARVVHGDYGCHNVLVGADGAVAAVVDWEISTLGDPLADLAYALNQWAEPGDPKGPREERPTALPGFPTRAEMAARYAARTGRDLSKLDYYVAFNRWKSAAIIHGVYSRYMAGKKSSEGVDLPALRASIENLLGLAQEAVNRLEA